MSHFYQENILSFKEAQKKLNDHLSDLEITDVLHSSSDTKHLLIKIYSKKHDNDYYFSIGTNNWSWKDFEGKNIPVISDQKIDEDFGLFETTDKLKEEIKNNLIIKNVELSKESQLLKIYFENNSVFEAREDKKSLDQSHYQLSIFGSKIYQNYDLLIMGDKCQEKVTNGAENGHYKVALFDLDYFRMEHRSFTTHAIQQAREKRSPVSFIQAKILYEALTTAISEESDLIFSPWRIRRSCADRIRLDTIPVKELIEITRDECKKQNFTTKEAKEILNFTVGEVKDFLKSGKDIKEIASQEYANQSIFDGLLEWYKKISN